MPAAAPTPIDFALFVTPIEGHLVTRYGTRSYIGVARQDKALVKRVTVANAKTGEKREREVSSPWSNDTALTWDTETIIPIPRAEYERFRKEYSRAVREGDLKTHTQKDWEAQRAERKKKAQEAAQKAADDAKAAAEKPAFTAA